MLTIKSMIATNSDGQPMTLPEAQIPANHRVRYHAGNYECIPEDEDWPEEVALA